MDPFVIVLSFLLFCNFPMEYEATVRYIDLSYHYDENTLFWPTAERYKMIVVNNETTEGGYWYQSEKISTATHTGTHLDAPCHFAKDGWSVEQIPLDRLISPAVVADVSQKVLDNADYQVSIEDLEEWERQHGELPQGNILLIRTGWARYWPNKSKYFGTDANDTTILRFPGISSEAAQWIVTRRNIFGIGLDTPSIDYGQSTDYKSHQILAVKNIFNLENVAEMNVLDPTGFMLYVMPMKLKGASGAPCRIVAAISEPECRTNAAMVIEHSFRLTKAMLALFCMKHFPRKLL